MSNEKLWSAIESMLDSSHSLASDNIRAYIRSRRISIRTANIDTDPPHEVAISPFRDPDTGLPLTWLQSLPETGSGRLILELA